MPYGLDQLTPLAEALAEQGLATWNLEYRRLGEAGGGWPGTFTDVELGLAHLATLAAQGQPVDLERVAVLGHSAGGQLALWVAAQAKREPRWQVRPRAVVALAPVADLVAAHDAGLGRRVVAELLDGAPHERPERYEAASPIERLPLGVPQLLLHGVDDTYVPLEQSRRYVAQARARGDEARLDALEGVGHLDFLEPASAAGLELLAQLRALVGRWDG
jgi:dipeptidyl aminopeptidase/acylaminoacyl peptidase